MANYVIDKKKCLIPSYDAETIEHISGYFVGEWSDGNPDGEDRTGRFVVSANEGNKIELADADGYVCGISEAYEGDTTRAKVNPIGVSTVQDNGALSVGDKCMPGAAGIAIKSSNNLGYIVVSRVDSTHVQIIAAPNNDMVKRIKDDNDKQDILINNIKKSVNTKQNKVLYGTTTPTSDQGSDGDVYIMIE